MKCGVRTAVISPGSRSTPLAHVALHTKGLEIIVDIDERSAAFVALGIGKVTGVPAVLICTSGTAVANHFPAVVEARMSQVPMIVLTADRPDHLQNCGAPQTIPQSNIFGKFSVHSSQLPSVSSGQGSREIITLAIDAYRRTIASDGGAVHINCQFDEPLQPISGKKKITQAQWSKTQQDIARKVLLFQRRDVSTSPLQRGINRQLRTTLQHSHSFAIVAGPDAARNDETTNAIIEFALQTNTPLFADVCSGVRTSTAALNYPDLLAQCLSQQNCGVDTVIWLGKYPTSKAIAAWMKFAKSVIRIQEHRDRIDPDDIVTQTLQGDTVVLLTLLTAAMPQRSPDIITRNIVSIEQRVKQAVESKATNSVVPQFIVAMRSIVENLPTESNVVLANSMSIRYADRFLDTLKPQHVFANKGVNGIDGTLSTAIGIAHATKQPTLLVTGDLALLHDLNALSLLARLQVPLTILLLNDNGGGIFHHLPIAYTIPEFENTEHRAVSSFEVTHGTPHTTDFEKVAAAFGVPYHRCELSEIADIDWMKPRLLEVCSPREENAQQYKNLTRATLETACQRHIQKSRTRKNSWHIARYGDPRNPPLLLLHGFAVSGSVWLPFVRKLCETYFLLVPDLLGHRYSQIDSDTSDTIAAVADSLYEILTTELSEPLRIVGYSMGARLAYVYAAQHPANIHSAMFISGTTGIADPIERAQRLQSDELLAKNISINGMEWFAEYWSKLPLLASRKNVNALQTKAMRNQWLRQDPQQLSQALRLFSVGNQPDVLPELCKVNFPAMLVAGTRDDKYSELTKQLAAKIPQWKVKYFDCGHDVLTEAPVELLSTMISFFAGNANR